jgi:predicted RNA binding protein YcfA (HicA-like mRNA interferase family)
MVLISIPLQQFKTKHPMKYSELEHKLKKAGCYPVKRQGRGDDHPIWYSPITGKEFETGHHKSQEVATGTLRKIQKAAGVKF